MINNCHWKQEGCLSIRPFWPLTLSINPNTLDSLLGWVFCPKMGAYCIQHFAPELNELSVYRWDEFLDTWVVRLCLMWILGVCSCWNIVGPTGKLMGQAMIFCKYLLSYIWAKCHKTTVWCLPKIWFKKILAKNLSHTLLIAQLSLQV